MPLYEGVGVVADRHAVVIDLGSAYTKCGYATEHFPRFIVPSEIKNLKDGTVRKVVDFSRPRASQYDILVEFLFDIYFKKLLVNPKERRVVLVESILSPTEYRNVLAEVLFNHFEVPTLLFIPSHLAACFPLGTQSGLVVDVGYAETVALPIYEGIPMLNCWQASPNAQKRSFQYLAETLQKYGCVKSSAGILNLSQYPELLSESVVEDIRTRTCFVTKLDRGKKLQSAMFRSDNVPKEELLLLIDKPPPSVEYSCGGGNALCVDGFIRESVCETFFKRDVDDKSICQMILDSVLKCPIDLRRYFLGRIHVIGGGSMSLGFLDRLKFDLLDLLKDPSEIYCAKLKVDCVKFFKSPVKPNYAAWLGASIFGGLEILPIRSISKDEFKLRPEIPDWIDAKKTFNSLQK